MSGAKRGRRPGFRMSEEHRLKIKTGNILSYLQRCALGETDMSATQVRAAEILLRKVLPDLSAADVTAEASGGIVVEIIKPGHGQGESDGGKE